MVQRLWSALLLIVAYEGTRLVARALGLPAFGAILAGLGYAVSPRLLGADGVLTGEILPSAVLPWAVLPLVLAGTGRLSARQAGLWSGVAVLCMSGVNAAGTLATLPIAAIVVLDQLRRPHGRTLAAWWAAGVAAACAWWMVPLLLLGKYSPPFLDFIETANATTAPTGWANDLRGADHWLSYYAIGDQPWWPGAHQMSTEPVLIVAGGLVAAIGLMGLCHREMPLRRALLASALIGLLCLTAGNPATLGSLVDGPVRDLLDGALAPFRNIHKVDPLVRLPLALGAAHAAVLLLRRLEPRRDLRRVTAVGAGRTGRSAAGPRCSPATSGCPASARCRRPGPRRPTTSSSSRTVARSCSPVPGSACRPGAGPSTSRSRASRPRPGWPAARCRSCRDRPRATSTPSSGGSPRARAAPAWPTLLARAGITHVVLRRDLDPLRGRDDPGRPGGARPGPARRAWSASPASAAAASATRR